MTNVVPKPGGLDLSQHGLDRDSWSWHWQIVSLDSRENLDNFNFKNFQNDQEVSIEIEK